MKFCAFIITYQRSEILVHTVEKLFQQSYPPEKILIIDNDPEQSASFVPLKYPHFEIEYIATTSNIGPAGAGMIALDHLAKEGYDWIAWMDDNDPPLFDDVFQILLNLAETKSKCGCVGAVGQYFNLRTGLIERVPDDQLEGKGAIDVDNVAGNMSKIISGRMIRDYGVLPNADLFFGFEELDYDLRIKKNGFSILVDKELYYRHRVFHNRIGFNYKRGLKKKHSSLWRDYYSIRNLMFILYENQSYMGLALTFVRVFYRSILGFRYGFRYGALNIKINLAAIRHFFAGRKGACDMFQTISL